MFPHISDMFVWLPSHWNGNSSFEIVGNLWFSLFIIQGTLQPAMENKIQQKLTSHRKSHSSTGLLDPVCLVCMSWLPSAKSLLYWHSRHCCWSKDKRIKMSLCSLDPQWLTDCCRFACVSLKCSGSYTSINTLYMWLLAALNADSDIIHSSSSVSLQWISHSVVFCVYWQRLTTVQVHL